MNCLDLEFHNDCHIGSVNVKMAPSLPSRLMFFTCIVPPYASTIALQCIAQPLAPSLPPLLRH